MQQLKKLAQRSNFTMSERGGTRGRGGRGRGAASSLLSKIPDDFKACLEWEEES